jgi:transcriptional regulator with XRE-family HTH domain
MRRVRGAAGVSLRELEMRGSWRRSTISQVENGKARPSRQLVEWYDTELGSNGLLLCIYAEARSRQLLARQGIDAGEPLDEVHVVGIDPPAGHAVHRGAWLPARVALRNGGTASWQGRALHRMGAHTGTRLIGSSPSTPVPDCEPGHCAEVSIELRAPDVPGSVVAFWTMVDDKGRECAQSSPPVVVSLVVD